MNQLLVIFAVLSLNFGVFLTEAANARQSPIDLYGAVTKSFSPLEFESINSMQSDVMVINEGHTLLVPLPNTYQVSGGGLPEAYIPEQFHLHWDRDGKGSEHAMYGEKYPAELHMVTRKSSLVTIGDALSTGERDGLAVFGFFFKETTYENVQWTRMIQAIGQIQNYESVNNVTIDDFSLSRLLYNGEDNFGEFFRYSGSLTTPPFSEVVTWTVFRAPIELSTAQMNVIRNLKYKNNDDVAPNFRAIQSLDRRMVEVSGSAIVEDQERLLAQPVKDIPPAPTSKPADNSVPESTVAVIFAIMAIVCLACMAGVLYLSHTSRRKDGKSPA